ncbi:MAG TPA: amidohydrolase family protein, partial [Acidothermaceae bacterium]
MDLDVGDIADCDVLVEDGKIAAIGRGLQVADALEVDAEGTIVLPGFIDTHRHTWQTAIRGVLGSCTLDGYLGAVLVRMGPEFRPEDVYIGNLLGSLEALSAGITTLYDWSHATNTPEHADAKIMGLREAGIRAVFG